jgi:hypothetical protein
VIKVDRGVLGGRVRARLSASTYQALRVGIWIPGQRQRLRLRLRQLAPGAWDQALAGVLGVSPVRPEDGSGRPVVEMTSYPDVT